MLTTFKQIKSYVLRQGKITTGQKEALVKLLPLYEIDYQSRSIDLTEKFGRTNKKIIEIGFGMGHATWQIAKTNPLNDYLGIEVHSPGVGSLLMLANNNQVTNLKIIQHDAVEVLKNMISDNSLDGVHIFFPDPWHKKKHHKRRIIQQHFIELLCRKLKLGGYIHIATDWEDYSEWIETILTTNPILKCSKVPENSRPVTKFEQRGLNLGHVIKDFYFIKAA